MRLRRRKNFAPFLSFMFLPALLLGYAPPVRSERLPVKTYTTEDGLIRNYVRQIFQDSHGYLWIVTGGGLSRFDGNAFANYGAEQSIPFQSINRMIEDRRGGGYWLATNGGGLYRFIPRLTAGNPASSFDKYLLGDNLLSTYVLTVYQDRSDRVWAGAFDGLFCLDEAKGETTFRRIALDPRQERPPGVSDIEEDAEGSLWIATSQGLFRRLPDERIVRYPIALNYEMGTAGEATAQLLYDDKGRIWLEHDAEFTVFMPEPAAAVAGEVAFRYLQKDIRPKAQDNYPLPTRPGEARRFQIAAELEKDDILDLRQSTDGRIWIATQRGLFEFDYGVMKRYSVDNGLSSNLLRSLGEDADGNLWIGTLGSGLMKIASSGFTSFTKADGMDEIQIIFMFADPSGEFYAGTDNNRICHFDGQSFKPIASTAFRRLIGTGRAFNHPILRDRAGEWWIGAEDGLHRFPAAQRIEQLSSIRPKAIYATKDGLPADRVYRIFEDSRGDIWFSFLSPSLAPLAKWERATNRFRLFGEREGLASSHEISSFCEDRQGNLWMGFLAAGIEGGGMARYSGNGFTTFPTGQEVPPGIVRNLFVDSQGRLWIATSLGGLARVDDPAADNPRFVKYTVATGLSDNEANCVTEDRWGYIYVGTGRGMDRIDPATGSITHYTMADGLPTSTINRIIRDSLMNFWVGTPNGLAHFIPKQDPPKPAPAMLITRLIIAGKERSISELGERQISDLELENEQNNLEISFVSPSFGFAKAIGYECKLEGSDSDWRSINQRTINYSSLAAGTYRFLVRPVSADGTLSKSPASVSFRVLSPVWQRWWFVLTALIVIAIPTIAVARYRHQQMKAVREAEEASRKSREERLIELEQVRRRIATDLHDDIGSSLSQVYLLSEVVRQRVGPDDSEVTEPLAMISSASEEMVNSMSDIVWAINPQKDHLSDLILRMRRFASDTFGTRDIAFRFSAPDADPDAEMDVRLGANIRREVFLIFKESVNNLVKHSGCTEAEIEFQMTDGSLLLRVSDNGKGFDASRDSDGHGLVSMRERATSIGGKFDLVSAAGRGTIVTFSSQLAQPHGPSVPTNTGGKGAG